MYHAPIRRRVLRTFTKLNEGEHEDSLGGMAEHFEHRFAGTSAIGGTRHTPPAFRSWFERLMRLMQGKLDIQVHHIAVAGQPLANYGNHVIRLRWFKAVGLYAMLDTVVWDATCARTVANGVEEADEAVLTVGDLYTATRSSSRDRSRHRGRGRRRWPHRRPSSGTGDRSRRAGVPVDLARRALRRAARLGPRGRDDVTRDETGLTRRHLEPCLGRTLGVPGLDDSRCRRQFVVVRPAQE